MRTIFAVALALATATALPALAQQEQPSQQDQQQARQAPLSADADNVVGKKAMTAQGKDVGEIQDVLIGQDGRVQAMIIDYDGKKRAVPWNQVTLQGDQVTVKLSEQQMSQLPEYSGKE